MKNLDFLHKELVNTFVYTTATQNRNAYTHVRINGRLYCKYGVLQAVTFAGYQYKVVNKETGLHQYVLCVGVSKQHPKDNKVDKELSYSLAKEKALIDPMMTIELPDKICKGEFCDIVEMYLNKMKLQFIKTKQEIELEGKNEDSIIG